jgi:hypothetical protein
MRWLALGWVTLVAACANSPPLDNPSSPNAFRPSTEEGAEARQLERAEADCASQGKHAVARRVEGDTVYDCVSSGS